MYNNTWVYGVIGNTIPCQGIIAGDRKFRKVIEARKLFGNGDKECPGALLKQN